MIMSEEFTQRNISWAIRGQISYLFANISEQNKKETLAEQVVMLLRQGLVDEALYKRTEELIKKGKLNN